MPRHSYIAAIVLLMLALAPPVRGAEKTDAQKKASVYAMYADYRKEFPEVPDIHPLKAMKLADAGRVVFVDTREPEEMAVSMLPDAVSKEAFLQNPSAYADRQVIVYCTISYRSGRFAREMADRGIRLTNLKGGLLAWVLEGGPVMNAGKVTRRIHVYGRQWALAPKGYETVVYPFWKRWF